MSARPTFTERPADYLMAQRESRDNVRYASALHQIGRQDTSYGKSFMATLYAVSAVALLVIWWTA